MGWFEAFLLKKNHQINDSGVKYGEFKQLYHVTAHEFELILSAFEYSLWVLYTV
jgi:hypothetical protein